ncbi:unnamed protein product [Schistocephalus solidus]|uniref:Not3 domain-containing protein n=1 Tax=Schistocephalus solidus TaxID=70667 RepID=A0A0V0J9I6_SCHSO|nr:unnamed protein product [Schistocephalus solidus]
MADKRKLQCDIDRTLKRVQEGRTSFQEILDKFESSGSQTQKEKFEADLKKEIKKLQRLRDQIKTWLTYNEIKDKRALLEARRVIEQDMERFKVIEKETKTKAYSKEGLLSSDAKKDPLQKEKEELDEWLKQSILSLQTQSEKYEFELENLATTGKKKRADKERAATTEEKRRKLEFCSFHIEKLETVMRHLDNERLDCAKVRSLKDQVEYIIECIDDVAIEQYQTLYEELHLEDLSDVPINLPNTAGTVDHDNTALQTPSSKTTEDLTDVPVLLIGSSASSNASSSRERQKFTDDKLTIMPPSASSASTPVKNISDGQSGRSGTSANTPKLAKGGGSNIANQTAPSSFFASSATVPSPNKNISMKSFAGATSASINAAQSASNQATSGSRLHSHSESDAAVSGKGSKTEGESADKTGETHREKYAKVAAESKAGNKSGKGGSKQDVNATEKHLTDSKSATPTATPSKTDSKNASGKGDSGPVDTSQKPSEELPEEPVAVTVALSNTLPSINTDPVVPSASAPGAVGSGKPGVFNLMPASSSFSYPSRPKELSDTMAVTSAMGRLSLLPTASANSALPIGSSVPPSMLSTQQKVGVDPAVAAAHHQQAAVMAAVAQQQQQQRMNAPCVVMHPRDSAAPFRNRQLDKPKHSFPPELIRQMQALESAYRRLPHPCDTEKSRMLVYKQPINTPSYYPSEPYKGSDTEEYFMKLDAQTLFFLFYYFEGTKAQYLAAKALKRMSWRFHTKYLMWFQRHEEPKQITDEYESGTYIYYDFKSMSQRKREEFVFHYSFLEDKDF